MAEPALRRRGGGRRRALADGATADPATGSIDLGAVVFTPDRRAHRHAHGRAGPAGGAGRHALPGDDHDALGRRAADARTTRRWPSASTCRFSSPRVPPHPAWSRPSARYRRPRARSSATRRGPRDPRSSTVLTVTPSDPAATGSDGGEAVQVALTVQSVRNVLAVPIAALVALAGGGYGLEVVAPSGQHHLVGVRTGVFAGGEVQVVGRRSDAGHQGRRRPMNALELHDVTKEHRGHRPCRRCATSA